MKAAVDCRETDGEAVREETGGKCLWKKAGQPWKQGNTAELCIGSGAITLASLPTSQQLNNGEAGP